ncbi:MAG TPA: ATP-binding protein, partial [Candidatus Defluviicoccus seviourii]|nr:ATP-binding protein [Candidatus Defluviicoccus seviourii]
LALLAVSDLMPAAAACAIAGLLIGCALVARQGLDRRNKPLAAPAPAPPEAPPQPLLDHLPDPVILVNRGREITAVNRMAREIVGVGEVGRDLALSMRHPRVLAAVEAVMTGASTVSEEITLAAPTPRTFTLHAARLDGAGAHSQAAAAAVLVLRDETRAKRAEQTRADFVANASHELRSPLSALIGFIETLLGPASDDAHARERFLGLMRAEAMRMARLVDDLMSLSRVEINEHVPPKDAVAIGAILQSVADTLSVRAEDKGMTIALDIDANLPFVLGDGDQLTQVFHNLVDNAVKYARTGTVVRLAAKRTERGAGGGQGVSVADIDAGDGIAAIHLPRLTERFYRADAGRSRRLGGTGLGLAIVKHIVNRHRGTLSIESKRGVGSTFTVVLPAAPSVGSTSQ